MDLQWWIGISGISLTTLISALYKIFKSRQSLKVKLQPGFLAYDKPVFYDFQEKSQLIFNDQRLSEDELLVAIIGRNLGREPITIEKIFFGGSDIPFSYSASNSLYSSNLPYRLESGASGQWIFSLRDILWALGGDPKNVKFQGKLYLGTGKEVKTQYISSNKIKEYFTQTTLL